MAKAHGGATRAGKILSVATDLFFEKGYGRVTVDEIGTAAGLTGPAIYRHFKGKGELLAALFDTAIDGVLSATGYTSSDARAELEHRVRAHAKYVLANRKLASIWVREGRSLSDEHRSRLRRRELNYVGQWMDCIQRCFPDLPRADIEVVTLTALGTLNSVSNWPKTTHAPADIADAVSGFVLYGLDRLGGERDGAVVAV